jgi:hypothetical protein
VEVFLDVVVIQKDLPFRVVVGAHVGELVSPGGADDVEVTV